MNRMAALTLASVAVAAVAAPPALAGKKKPITGSYTATAAAPDPTNYGTAAGQGKYPVCEQNVPGSFDKHAFSVPARGVLHIEMSGFQGDWDLLLVDTAGEMVGQSGNGAGQDEATDVSFKKAQQISIIACNWAGTPTANVKYAFSYK